MATDNEWLRLIYAQLVASAGGGGAGGATEATLQTLGREATLQLVSSIAYGIRADLSIDLQKGQKLMDFSLPVAIAVNQSPIPVVTDVLARMLDITASEYTAGSGSSDLGHWTVPAGKQWEFLCMSVAYTSPATGAGRQMIATMFGGIGTQFVCPVGHAPSQTISYAIAPGLVEYPAVRQASLTICTAPMVLDAGGYFGLFMQNAQAADTRLGQCLFVNERSR
jgi:hypothetical protein